MPPIVDARVHYFWFFGLLRGKAAERYRSESSQGVTPPRGSKSYGCRRSWLRFLQQWWFWPFLCPARVSPVGFHQAHRRRGDAMAGVLSMRTLTVHIERPDGRERLVACTTVRGVVTIPAVSAAVAMMG
jgi:hypothetical protein